MTAIRDPESDEVHDNAYEGAKAFVVSSPFDPGQLDAEITKAMNWKNSAGLIVEGDPAKASKTDPVRLWVIRGEVDEKVVADVVKKHKPNEETKFDLDTLKARVKSGEVLDPREQTALLAHLVG